MAVGSGAVLGFDALLGYGQETTWGTLVTATSFMEFRSESLKKNIEEEKLESLGTGRAFARRIQKNISVEGTLSYDLHPVDGISLIKHALMGTVTSAAAGTSDSFNHTFTAGDISGISQKGLTFEVRPQSDTQSAFIFYGCRVNSMKISGSINEPVKCEMEIVGKDGTTGTFATTTVAYSTVRPYIFADGTFTIDGTIGSLTSTSDENIIAFELTVNNNLNSDESSRSIGDSALTNLPPGKREIMLNITQRFDTTTAWSRFINATQGAVRLKLDTGVTIGSADTNVTTYSMFIDLPKVYYNQAQPEIPDSGIITHEIEISAIGDTVTSSPTDIVVTVTNSASSYA